MKTNLQDISSFPTPIDTEENSYLLVLFRSKGSHFCQCPSDPYFSFLLTIEKKEELFFFEWLNWDWSRKSLVMNVEANFRREKMIEIWSGSIHGFWLVRYDMRVSRLIISEAFCLSDSSTRQHSLDSPSGVSRSITQVDERRRTTTITCWWNPVFPLRSFHQKDVYDHEPCGHASFWVQAGLYKVLALDFWESVPWLVLFLLYDRKRESIDLFEPNWAFCLLPRLI